MTSVVGQAPHPMLFNDLVANRGQIDAKFSTHGTVRGEVQNQAESGISKQITREGDLVTSDDIVEIVVERAVEEMASWAIQMEKLFYDKPHFVRNMGEDGELLYAEVTRDLIDDGIGVGVKASAVDKATRRAQALELAGTKAIDPLTLAQDLDLSNPKERTRRLLLFQMGEQDQWARYMQETGLIEDDQEEGAMGADQARSDIQALVAGQSPQPQGIPDEAYVQAFAQFVNSPDFDNLDKDSQNRVRDYVRTLRQQVNQPTGGQGAIEPPGQENIVQV